MPKQGRCGSHAPSSVRDAWSRGAHKARATNQCQVEQHRADTALAQTDAGQQEHSPRSTPIHERMPGMQLHPFPALPSTRYALKTC